MHSSRMHTAHLLTVSQHVLLGGLPARGMYLPGGVPPQGGVPAQGGAPGQGGVPARDVPTQGVYLPRGCTCQGVYLARGCTCKGGVPAQGCVLAQGGVPSPGGTCPGTPDLVNRMTDRQV